jgi:putative FmdB family regulatory protein
MGPGDRPARSGEPTEPTMPIYEYECDKCGYAFEREQRMSDPPVKTCPKCRGRKVTKLISRTSFVLKGGGWYADGYSDSKAKKSGDSDSGASGDAAAPASDGGTKSGDKSGSKGSTKSDKGSAKASSRSAA